MQFRLAGSSKCCPSAFLFSCCVSTRQREVNLHCVSTEGQQSERLLGLGTLSVQTLCHCCLSVFLWASSLGAENNCLKSLFVFGIHFFISKIKKRKAKTNKIFFQPSHLKYIFVNLHLSKMPLSSSVFYHHLKKCKI